jgi:SAM-dependent methyltransferase
MSPSFADENRAVETDKQTLPESEQKLGLPPVRDGYRRYYSHWHDDTDAHFAQMVSYYERKLTNVLGDLRGSKVMEIGCGVGFCLGALVRLGVSTVEGIDADEGQVKMAQKRLSCALHVPVSQFAAYAVGRPGAFDWILMFDVLEHVPGEERLMFLRRVWTMLKPGGRLLCQVPNANSFVASRYRYNDATHYTAFTEDSLDFELYRAGFDDILVEEADPIQRPWWRRPREIVRWLAHRTMRYAIRWCYQLEIGRSDANRIPLTPNIIAIAVRTRGADS